MGVNKVVYGDSTLIDLTSDTVTAQNLLAGATAHGANGEPITGTYTPSGDSDPYPVRNDGHTHVWVNIPSLSDADVTIYLRVSSNGGARIDWGDGSTTTTSGTAVASYTHTYTSTGLKEIIFSHTGSASRGYYFQTTYSIMGYNADHFGDSNTKKLKAVEIGGTSSASRANVGRFIGCVELEKVTYIAKSGTGNLSLSKTFSTHTDYSAINAQVFLLPKLRTVKVIGAKVNFNSDGLFKSLPMLESVEIDGYTTSAGRSVSLYDGCGRLKSIPNIAPFTTSIGENYCRNCSALQTALTIPGGVTEIGASAFENCISLREIHFIPTTPPTLADDTCLNTLWDCTIYVRTGTLADYQSAEHYPRESWGRVRYVEE